MSEIPPVVIIDAIKPANTGSGEPVLRYDGLEAAVNTYATTHRQRAAAFWDSEPDSLAEEYAGRQLALEYCVRTAARAVDTESELWADRFTKANIEIYGQPEQDEALRLLAADRQELLDLQSEDHVSQSHIDYLLGVYEPFLAAHPDSTAKPSAETAAERQAIKAYGAAVLKVYGPMFELVDSNGPQQLEASAMLTLFESALNWLLDNDDDEWADWQVIPFDSTLLSVNSSAKEIRVGQQRKDARPSKVRGLLAHELLVHALRGKNGYKTGDPELAIGLAFSMDAEEGLGILTDEAVNDRASEEHSDRYRLIALALGTLDGRQRNRQEIFDINFARQLVRNQSEHPEEKINIDKFTRGAWSQVDRIYRGGPGKFDDRAQAIYVKDITYHVGYTRMAAYITEQLAAGKTADEVFAYLSLGKFDPTNPKHTERLAEAWHNPDLR